MTRALAGDWDVRQVPDVALMPPQGIDSVTPLAAAFGIEEDPEPSFLRQARAFADRNPSAPTAWVRLAQAAQSVGNDDLAAEAATNALKASEGPELGSAARYVAASILARLEPSRADHFFEGVSNSLADVARAKLAVQREDYAEALARLRRVKGPAAGALRGYCLTVAGQHARAVAEFRSVRRSGRDSIDVLINLGVALAHLGQVEKAARVTRQATAMAPINAVASYNLARYLVRMGRADESVRELDRVAAVRQGDYKAALYSAWAHATQLHDSHAALVRLNRARNHFAQSGNDIARAEISASIAYLRYRAGDLTKARAKTALWSAFRLSPSESPEIVNMLAALLDRKSESQELRYLIDAAEMAPDTTDSYLLDARLKYLTDDLDGAVQAALLAASSDSGFTTAAASMATYLLGEVGGEYQEAAEIGRRALEVDPDETLANNCAFALALGGRGDEALRVLAGFDESRLPFHGATVGLVQLALGNFSTGWGYYRLAERLLREDGDDRTADLVATRGRLALRQFGASHDEASEERVLASWPKDSDDPRVSVMRRVALRVGVAVEP